MFKLLLTSILVIYFLSSNLFAQSGAITIALPNKFSGLDTLSAYIPDSAADRLRNLIYNSLVKKNEKFEYVGDLAKDIKIGEDNLSVTFTLNDNVKFQNGKVFTSADAKYTLIALFQANGYKAGSFFDTVDGKKAPHITAIETPDAKTISFKVARPALVNQLLSNLVAIPIIPEGSLDQQKTQPIGTGAFKFVSFDQLNSVVELQGNPDYWEGAPKIQKLTVKTVTDSITLQEELQNGSVDIVPNPDNFSAETFKLIGQNPDLQVIKTDGSNVRYISFNLQNKTFRNVNFRQAIAYAIDRERLIKEVIGGQATLAHSILPPQSWAYSSNIKYEFNQAKAKNLLRKSGYRGQIVKLKIAEGNSEVSQYAQIIQSMLKEVGISIQIEAIDRNTLLEEIKQGKFQMTTSQWVGGNHDPIFLKDLFESKESTTIKPTGRNRSRYSNPVFDKLIRTAMNATDKDIARKSYVMAQDIVARDLPLFPLWHPSNIVVANKRIGNIQISISGDWSFIKNLTLK